MSTSSEEKDRDYEEALGRLPIPPRDRGTVHLVVARLPGEKRETPERAQFTVEGGLEGDRWSLDGPPKPETQVTLMHVEVARLFSGGQGLTLFGDNLLVDIDLSVDSLPTGTCLRIGTALFEVTEKAHTGCKKFRQRFGLDALKIINRPEWNRIGYAVSS